jgi:hypothetical protein
MFPPPILNQDFHDRSSLRLSIYQIYRFSALKISTSQSGHFPKPPNLQERQVPLRRRGPLIRPLLVKPVIAGFIRADFSHRSD